MQSEYRSVIGHQDVKPRVFGVAHLENGITSCPKGSQISLIAINTNKVIINLIRVLMPPLRPDGMTKWAYSLHIFSQIA